MNHTPQATVAPRKALRASFTHRTDTSWHSMQQVQGEGWRLRQSLAPWSPHPRQLVEPKRKKWPNNSMQHINLLHHLRNNNILTMFNCPLPTSPGSYDLLRVATQLAGFKRPSHVTWKPVLYTDGNCTHDCASSTMVHVRNIRGFTGTIFGPSKLTSMQKANHFHHSMFGTLKTWIY